jgi:hypothetical protein
MSSGGVDMAVDALEVRIARLEGAYEQMDKRLATIEVDIRELRGDVQAVRTELLSRMDRQFFWIIGLLIVSILLPIALRFTGVTP